MLNSFLVENNLRVVVKRISMQSESDIMVVLESKDDSRSIAFRNRSGKLSYLYVYAYNKTGMEALIAFIEQLANLDAQLFFYPSEEPLAEVKPFAPCMDLQSIRFLETELNAMLDTCGEYAI